MSATVTATLQNAGPTVNMVTVPASPLALGLSHPFRAEIRDDSSAGPIVLSSPELCPQMIWTSDQASDPQPLATGCDVQIAFASPGPRTVEASYTDSYSQKGSALAALNVGSLAAGTLGVAIQSPFNGASFFASDVIAVEYQINDPAPASPPSCTETWTLTRKGTSDSRPIAMQKVNGKSQFVLDEVFPEFGFSSSGVHYILTLEVQSSTGANGGPATIELHQFALIH